MTNHAHQGFSDALSGTPSFSRPIAADQVLHYFDVATRDLTAALALPRERALAIVLALLSEELAATRFKSSLTDLIAQADTDTLAHARVLQDIRLRALSEANPAAWSFLQPIERTAH